MVSLVRTEQTGSGRRAFLKMLLAGPVALAAVSRLRWLDQAAAAEAPKPAGAGKNPAPTPECGDDDDPTPSETQGPFYKPRSPLRASLVEAGTQGTRIVVTGRVFTTRCRPVPGALLDFWQADDDGEYDNEGYRLRGHQFADASGRYRLETIVPGLYPGRTRHIHVRVQAPQGRVLSTQLYFPGETRNREDPLFRSDLLMAVKDAEKTREGRFHFILST
jgi:protocatechuate 3,4-dioxygenase beta subunit